MNYKLESWPTFKKRETPKLYFVNDGVKGWAKEIIQPTMRKLGWCYTYVADYGIIKPKEWAKKEVADLLQLKNVDKSHFVYSFSKGKNGYMDVVQVFYKLIK